MIALSSLAPTPTAPWEARNFPNNGNQLAGMSNYTANLFSFASIPPATTTPREFSRLPPVRGFLETHSAVVNLTTRNFAANCKLSVGHGYFRQTWHNWEFSSVTTSSLKIFAIIYILNICLENVQCSDWYLLLILRCTDLLQSVFFCFHIFHSY